MKIECSICLDELTPPSKSPITSAACGHLFHKNCITGWLTNVNNCPQCRAPCDRKQLREVFFNNFADRRNSEIFNLTIVKDMNELQNQLLTEQDTLILAKCELEEEIQRLRNQLDQKDRETADLKAQLKSKIDRIADLEKENARTQFTNQVYKYAIRK